MHYLLIYSENKTTHFLICMVQSNLFFGISPEFFAVLFLCCFWTTRHWTFTGSVWYEPVEKIEQSLIFNYKNTIHKQIVDISVIF